MKRFRATFMLALACMAIPVSAVPYCWNDMGDGCWLHANWDSWGNETHWYMGCQDGTYASGSFSGDMTSILCD